MTRKSVFEYAAAIRAIYRRASKAEKKVMLNEFCRATGYHRKAAIRLLNRQPKAAAARRGRPVTDSLETMRALKVAWDASDHICSKRLAPFLATLVPVLEHHGELTNLSPATREQVMHLSASRIDRLLKPYRDRDIRRPRSSSRSVSWLRSQVPVRTFAQWHNVEVGHVQMDLVAHCGMSTEGFYLYTLLAVDLVTGWVECEPTWGKGQTRVGTAVHHARRRLPFALHGIHADNGGEFLNARLYSYCQREQITFTRSRPYRKNDNAHAEQKNWGVVRRVVGYGRYSSKAAYQQLHALYQPVRLYMNFFQPIRKLIAKEHVGAKTRKHFDQAQTPYQRLLRAGVLSPENRQVLELLYQSLNPVALLNQIETALSTLWKLEERLNEGRPPEPLSEPDPEDASGTATLLPSVTLSNEATPALR